MPTGVIRHARIIVRTGALLLSCALLTGCSTSAINAARREFYKGNLSQAEEEIYKADVDDNNQVLLLMERGTILQANSKYAKSSDDFIRANDRLEELETYSVSKGAASLVINDNVQSFIGVPFERAMLHDLTALNHYALSQWEHGAVESRRIIKIQDKDIRGDYPDDAFSRYIAGFGLGLVDDDSNAALQYALAAELLSDLEIDPATGHVAPPPSTNGSSRLRPPDPATSNYTGRLTCFVLLSKSPSGEELLNSVGRATPAAPYAEFYHDGNYLGRSYTLTDVAQIAYLTAEKEALRRAAKTAARIAVKEGVASSFDNNDLAPIGALIRIVFIGLLEQPDTRRWETLPQWIQVATVPCPADLSEFEAVIKSPAGIPRSSRSITHPITRKRNQFVSFFRDLPLPPTPVTAP
jgi:hypothetical protein